MDRSPREGIALGVEHLGPGCICRPRGREWRMTSGMPIELLKRFGVGVVMLFFGGFGLFAEVKVFRCGTGRCPGRRGRRRLRCRWSLRCLGLHGNEVLIEGFPRGGLASVFELGLQANHLGGRLSWYSTS